MNLNMVFCRFWVFVFGCFLLTLCCSKILVRIFEGLAFD